MRRIGVLMGLGRMLVSFARLLVRGGVVVFAVVLGGRTVRLRCVLVVLRGFGMGFLRHVLLLGWFALRNGARRSVG